LFAFSFVSVLFRSLAIPRHPTCLDEDKFEAHKNGQMAKTLDQILATLPKAQRDRIEARFQKLREEMERTRPDKEREQRLNSMRPVLSSVASKP
jgi:hypothetical protein